jgi:Tol biopolymer transport system component
LRQRTRFFVIGLLGALLPALKISAVGLEKPAKPSIALTRIGPSSIQLFISDADGSAERPLLNSDSRDYNPVWSKDGQWIAFTSERNGSADLYRIKPDGTGLELLTASPSYDDQADYSPDGQHLVFVSTLLGHGWIKDDRLIPRGRSWVRELERMEGDREKGPWLFP